MEPLRLSWSSLRVHDECHQKAKLIRSGKKNPAADIRGYFHGTVVDRVMRQWLEDPKPGLMPAMVEEFVDRCEKDAIESEDGVVRWKHTNDKKQMTAWCVRLVKKLEPILEELVVPFEYEPALRFAVPYEIPYLDGTPTQVILSGEIDLLTRNDGAWGLWDLKATEDNGYWRKTVAQLTFYDICVEAMFGSSPSEAGLIQPMCDEQVLRVKITEKERAELLARVVRMAQAMWKADESLAPTTKPCFNCAVKHACPRFRPRRPRTA